MPQLFEGEFPDKPKRAHRYTELFDGQCWKASPAEYKFDVEDVQSFVASLKSAAHAQGVYIRAFVTLDNSVIVQRRPLDYKPVPRAARKVKES